ncbi:hypothetical protein EV182_003062 [Spiromyces aspiralis]|uniref:Uncharacterized protein n=1 Tax=Spiromyces aspiralis TaxID=68401 RepID=A0ACC1HSC4_9FUNG|nr:hypothetical protein EV182_003062 [Spiromyces aspiralis]
MALPDTTRANIVAANNKNINKKNASINSKQQAAQSRIVPASTLQNPSARLNTNAKPFVPSGPPAQGSKVFAEVNKALNARNNRARSASHGSSTATQPPGVTAASDSMEIDTAAQTTPMVSTGAAGSLTEKATSVFAKAHNQLKQSQQQRPAKKGETGGIQIRNAGATGNNTAKQAQPKSQQQQQQSKPAKAQSLAEGQGGGDLIMGILNKNNLGSNLQTKKAKNLTKSTKNAAAGVTLQQAQQLVKQQQNARSKAGVKQKEPEGVAAASSSNTTPNLTLRPLREILAAKRRKQEAASGSGGGEPIADAELEASETSVATMTDRSSTATSSRTNSPPTGTPILDMTTAAVPSTVAPDGLGGDGGGVSAAAPTLNEPQGDQPKVTNRPATMLPPTAPPLSVALTDGRSSLLRQAAINSLGPVTSSSETVTLNPQQLQRAPTPATTFAPEPLASIPQIKRPATSSPPKFPSLNASPTPAPAPAVAPRPAKRPLSSAISSPFSGFGTPQGLSTASNMAHREVGPASTPAGRNTPFPTQNNSATPHTVELHRLNAEFEEEMEALRNNLPFAGPIEFERAHGLSNKDRAFAELQAEFEKDMERLRGQRNLATPSQ